MFKFIAGLITGITITVIGWQTAAMAIIDLVKQIVERIK